MVCGILTLPQTSHLCRRSASTIGSTRSPKLSHGTPRILCSNSSPDMPLTSDKLENSAPMTGGAFDFKKATISLTDELMSSSKKVTLLRHGLSTWNEESRIQGSSNMSVLTETGIKQAERCKRALSNIHFDKCFSSPISRAKSTAEIVWQGREEPLVFIDSLGEVHLFFLEGMKNEFGGSGCQADISKRVYNMERGPG